MAYRLPPLNSLRLFEAAGRHLSFRLAADELGLTPSALSHGVQSLESWLGCRLFHRASRGLILTEAGAAYLSEVREALRRLAQASDAVSRPRPRGRLSISVAPTFGLRWLMPHLPLFRARHPQIEISFDTEQRQVELAGEPVDLAIRMGRGDWPGLQAIHLVTEALAPVAAPSLADRVRGVEDLAAETLLHVVTVAEDWRCWSQLSGLAPDRLERGPRFDSIHMALEAAAQGQGIAIGRWPLIATDIAAGKLVSFCAPPVSCSTGYWLVGQAEAFARPEAAAFRGWIQSAFARAA
jgi:LysR family glycine cleavage system transcriptional activator